MQKEHFEILLESIDSKVQITMEAVLALNLKLDTKVDELRVELKQDIAHRNNTELHHAQPKRPLKRA